MKFIDREALMKLFQEYQPHLATNVCEFGHALKELPTVEINEDMIIEYCRKRHLVIMTAELFADWFMNRRIEDAFNRNMVGN